jgi:iron(III) transport system substrate-binding protein
LESFQEIAMAETLFTALISLLAFTRAVSATPASAQETAGQVLAKLEKLSAENRQKVLVERARSEKEVTFYSSLQTADAEPYVKAFNKRYPFIKVNIYRISGQKQVIMIQSEFNAGRHAFDITNASAAQAFGIKKTGALDSYQSPQRQYFSTAHKDKEGYFTPTYIVPVVLGYNTNMVKRNETPKRYEPARAQMEGQYDFGHRGVSLVCGIAQTLWQGKGIGLHEEARQTGDLDGPRAHHPGTTHQRGRASPRHSAQ